jgi:hypothetical protein
MSLSDDDKAGRQGAASARIALDAAFGRSAAPEARAVGGAIKPRAVFGWPALIEKILARDIGVDDETLEVAKVASLLRAEGLVVDFQRELLSA